MTLPAGTGYSRDYSFTMRDAHRRPAQPVKPPAVTWHLAFRRPPIGTDFFWYRQIEDVVLALFDQCVGQAIETPGDHLAWAEISNLHQTPTRVDASNKNGKHSVTLFRHTYEYSHSGSGTHAVDEAVPFHIGRYETVVIHGHWSKLPYWLRAEVFEEYFTLTTSIGLVAEEGGQGAVGKTGLPLMDTHLESIRRYANERIGKLRAAPHEQLPKTAPSDVTDAVDWFYNGIWKTFSARFLDNTFNRTDTFVRWPTARSPVDCLKPLSLLRSVFANFHGLVLRVCPSDEDGEIPLQPRKLEGCLDAPRARPDASMKARIHGATEKLAKNDDEANLWVECILPLLLAHDGLAPKSQWHRPFEPTEYTFSKFGDGRFIYGSGFGPQLSRADPGAPGAGSPLTYILLSFHDEWRQIGRTVLRLHTLGTLRLAALFELNKLMTRDQILLGLERELHEFDQIRTMDAVRERRSAAFRHLAKLLPEVRDNERFSARIAPDADRIQETHAQATHLTTSLMRHFLYRWSRRRIRSSVVAVHEQLEEMKATIKLEMDPSDERSQRLSSLREAIRCCELFLQSRSLEGFRTVLLDHVRNSLTGMDEGIKDGITYRAARSTYARERYESLAKAMQIQRIRGFQPYDVFVRHRLDRAYGLIQAIDARFKQVSDVEMHLRQRLDGEKSVRHQGVLSKLQRTAEVAFWFVLAPYYLGHTAEALAINWFSVKATHEVQFWVTAGTVALGIIWFARHLGHTRSLAKTEGHH